MPNEEYAKDARAYRSQSIEGEFRQSQNFDKAVLTLSSGALGLSLVFIKDLVPEPTSTGSLLAAWILFGVAVASILIAMVFSQRGYRRERKLLNDDVSGQDTSAEKNGWASATKAMNLLAVGAFLFGVVFLICFVHKNIRTGEQTMSDQQDYRVPNYPFKESAVPPERPVKPSPPAILPDKEGKAPAEKPSPEPAKSDPDQGQDDG